MPAHLTPKWRVYRPDYWVHRRRACYRSVCGRLVHVAYRGVAYRGKLGLQRAIATISLRAAVKLDTDAHLSEAGS
jgi:hypothetical protein